ncbi:MAG: cohesin domain-containing protein [Phaeodactylibacter sp.]|uniref:cohesin domain-containing protein n=1 Tax=Phaeodactylibacter sp. TaxID=1940289 RepID=UPI0032EDF646
MTKKIPPVRAFLAVPFLLFLPFCVSAQVAVYATNHTVIPDEEFTVEIKAQNFDSVVGCQFSVAWDTTLFRLKEDSGVLSSELESFIENFNYSQADSGYLGFLWFDPGIQPVSLEDDATLFTIGFEVVEEESTIDSIRFAAFPVMVEFANADEEELDVDFISGAISIEGISDLLDRQGRETVLVSCAPNPFAKQTQISLDFKQRVDRATLRIINAQGEVVMQREQSFDQGLHMLDLDRKVFGQSGQYYLEIKSTDFIVTHKLIVL